MEHKYGQKPYRTVNSFYQEMFGTKVFRVPLNGGFTCPNRDGTLGYDGCIYCSESGSGDFAGDIKEPLETQYRKIKAMMNKKWPIGKTIVYFQANTNTYAPLSKLKELYETALALDDAICGIAIATRPDCLDDDLLDYLETLNENTFVTVELGLETIHQKTSEFINRGHDLHTFTDAIFRLNAHNIHSVAHIINGLPGETEAMMLENITYLNKLPLQGVKIHMLYITTDSRLGSTYRNNPFPLLSKTEYCEIVARQIEIMRPDLIIYRLTGDAPKEKLLAPMWTQKKFTVVNDIDKLLRAKKSFQGKDYRHD